MYPSSCLTASVSRTGLVLLASPSLSPELQMSRPHALQPIGQDVASSALRTVPSDTCSARAFTLPTMYVGTGLNYCSQTGANYIII